MISLLLVAATVAEIAPTLKHFGLDPENLSAAPIRTGRYVINTCITGAGMMQATYALTTHLLDLPYDFVLQAGIGGSFDTSIPLGSIVAVRSEQQGDTGAEDRGAFIDVFDLGFADKDEFPFKSGQLVNPMESIPLPLPELMVDGITVNTVSGHEPTIAMRKNLYNPVVESMEGAALHYTCLQMEVPFLQVRAISNYVTPRDRESWQIGKAIGALNKQLIEWLQ